MESTISNRLIGIEVEVICPIIGTGDNADVQRLIAEVLSNQGIRSVARSYTHQPVPTGCKMAIEHDVSLRDESKYAGLRWSKIEAKTMPMTWQEIEETLPRALEIIRYCGARINYSCGLHVHHHLPEVERKPEVVKSLWNLWWRYHNVFYGLTAQSRRTNNYCFPPRQQDARMFDRCSSFAKLCGILDHVNRYNGLNLTNLIKRDRQTVEWRFHAGTTDWSKIKAWVVATQRWVEHAVARSCHFKQEPFPNTQASLNSLLVTTGLKPNSRIYNKIDKDLRQVGKYLLRRWKHFNSPRNIDLKADAA